MNNQFPQLPGGVNALAVVPVDVGTGLPLAPFDPSRIVKILGRCSDVDNVLRDAWDGPTPVYVFPTVAQQMQIVSTNANDTVAGTGLRRVRVYYLDTNYVEREEFINLNGTTPVLTVATNILRVNKVHAVAVGSNGLAVGTVSLQAVGGAVTYSAIPAGRNFARQAIYTVPAGKKLQILQWQTSSGSTGEHFCQHTLLPAYASRHLGRRRLYGGGLSAQGRPRDAKRGRGNQLSFCKRVLPRTKRLARL